MFNLITMIKERKSIMSEIDHLIGKLMRERDEARYDLSVQKGETERLKRQNEALILELETYKKEQSQHQLRIKGWFCKHCQTFNGEERITHDKCRVCQEKKTE